ncbi:hypothetical protein D9M73_298490 [compost metagenome]
MHELHTVQDRCSLVAQVQHAVEHGIVGREVRLVLSEPRANSNVPGEVQPHYGGQLVVQVRIAAHLAEDASYAGELTEELRSGPSGPVAICQGTVLGDLPEARGGQHGAVR